MRIPRLQISPPLAIGVRTLDPDTSHYLIRVLRRRASDAVRVFDGAGNSADAVVITADQKQCVLELAQAFADNLESPLLVHLGLALLKGDRMDTALQKACELGVAEITPLTTERTEVRLEGKRLVSKQRHWSEVLRHAAQQSGRSRVPLLHDPMALRDFLQTRTDAVPGLIMDPSGGGLNTLDLPAQPQQLRLVTGPEGGFSDAELLSSDTANYRRMSVGPRILRAETAPLVGLTLLHARFGDLLDQAPDARA